MAPPLAPGNLNKDGVTLKYMGKINAYQAAA